MEFTLLYRTPTYAVIILLFLLSLLFHWIGYKIKQKRIKENRQTKNKI